ncbi:DUF4382 domain-containing protein [Meiothermus cerbereus]|uniref:DUF4382 domain-containing protein n=1 Tax=Meiothermus cerbereus TaxID=65552 RepID=UPI003EEC7FE9
MNPTFFRILSVAFLLAPLIAGCNSSPASVKQPNFQALLVAADPSSSTLVQSVSSLKPLDRSKTDLSQIARVVVNLDRIELVGEGGRVVGLEPNPALGDSDADGKPDLDLLALSNRATPIVKGTIPAGVYTQFRLFSPVELGPEAAAVYLVMKDGSKIPLRIPSGQQTGLKLVIQGRFDVRVDAITTLTLAFDLGRSLVRTGNGRYMLKPVVKASGDVASGAVNGRVTFKGGRPAQDAEVEARSANNTYLTTTSADGLYSFLALAAPASYEFTFRFQTPEGVVYLTRKTLSIPANTTTTVNAEFELTGGITVSLKSASAPSNVAVEVKDASGVTVASSSQADPDGKYTFATLLPGTYSVSASAAVGGAPVTGQATGVVVEDFKMTKVEIELK